VAALPPAPSDASAPLSTKQRAAAWRRRQCTFLQNVAIDYVRSVLAAGASLIQMAVRTNQACWFGMQAIISHHQQIAQIIIHFPQTTFSGQISVLFCFPENVNALSQTPVFAVFSCIIFPIRTRSPRHPRWSPPRPSLQF
jgi:hypothetical protein